LFGLFGLSGAAEGRIPYSKFKMPAKPDSKFKIQNSRSKPFRSRFRLSVLLFLLSAFCLLFSVSPIF
jgi:hypothetical protein